MACKVYQTLSSRHPTHTDPYSTGLTNSHATSEHLEVEYRQSANPQECGIFSYLKYVHFHVFSSDMQFVSTIFVQALTHWSHRIDWSTFHTTSDHFEVEYYKYYKKMPESWDHQESKFLYESSEVACKLSQPGTHTKILTSTAGPSFMPPRST
jgi:hypothetical protein